MTLSITDLFTPAPSGVSLGDPTAAIPSGSWLAQLLANAATLGLPTTAWQPGGITRTELAKLALALAGSDQVVSTMAQGGFLDWAAAVTPAPAVLGSAATPGWLDKLAQSTFNVTRTAATYAPGTVTFTNSFASSHGPYAPGTFHVANAAGRTYSNTSSITIAGSGTTTAAFQADVAGSASTAAPGTITTIVTSLVGVTVTNAASFIGTDAQSNASLVLACRNKQGSLSPNGPKSAYYYFALQASTILGALTPPVALQHPINRALVQANTSTGVVTTTIANAAGTTDGAVSLVVSGATNASPIVVTVPSTTGVIAGDWVLVQGVQGNTSANGYWIAGTVTGTTIALTGSAGNGTYLSGGTVEGGDLGLVDSVIQANVVPLGRTAVTQWATSLAVTVVVTVYVPAAQGSAVVATVQNAVASYIGNVPIGGFVTGVVTPNTIPNAGLCAACAIAAPYIQDISATMNGSGVDLALTALQVPTLVLPVSVVVRTF
jgi:hypothetical protein